MSASVGNDRWVVAVAHKYNVVIAGNAGNERVSNLRLAVGRF
jgi:hypothetical protein